MQNTTSDYKLEIAKDNIEVNAKIIIGNNVYTSQDLTNLVLEYTQSQEGFTIGNTLSQSLDLTLLNRGDIIYSTSQIKLEIGLKIGDKYEYIPMGVFNIDDVVKTDYTTKFTCYDNMIKFEKTFKTNLGDTLTLQQVVNELTRITGVEFTGSLPNYTVSKLEGFTCREVLSYVASICGGNAIITRDGKFTIKGLTEVEKSIDGHNIILNNFKTEELKYKVGQVSCQVNDTILTKGSLGTDSMELQFENPWITESILNDIYNKVKTVEYLGYSMKWTGDLALDPYDIVLVTDAKNVTRKFPILSQKLTCTKGIISEIGAKGETKNKNSFSSSGSTTNRLNRVSIELAVINTALIDKANIKDLEAVSIRTQNLEAKTAKIEEAIINVAHIEDLNAINANIEKLIAADATINNALIGKADIIELNAVKGTINVLESDTANIKNLLAGNISGESGQLIHLTASNIVIADAVIKDLIAANISVENLKTSDISTNKFRIVSDSGNMLISDNTIQISDNNRVRVQIGKDASNDYNMYVWDSAGKLMFDATGLKADGIKNKIIRDDMISDNANIDGSKININSLITEINKDTNTTVIKSSKVQIDTLGQTLEVAFNSLKSSVDGFDERIQANTTAITVAQGKIDGLISENTIIKGDVTTISDKYTSLKATVDGINTTVASHTSSITTIKNTADNAQSIANSASLKIDNLQIGGRNLQRNTDFKSDLSNWSVDEGYTIDTTKRFENVNTVKFTRSGLTVDLIRWMYSGRTVIPIEVGQAVTASANFYTDDVSSIDGGKAFIGIWFYDSNGSAVSSSQIPIPFINGSWIKAHCTAIAPVNTRYAAIVFGVSRNGTYYIAKPMFEKGNKASDWSLAPEDLDSAISTVDTKVTTVENKYTSLSQDLNGFKTTVSNNYSTKTELSTVDGKVTGLTSRVSTAESSITQLNNKIALKVEATDITEAINNVEFGGRNYVLDSDVYITENTSRGFNFSILQELRGKTITLSVEVDLNSVVGSRVGFEPSIRFSDGTSQYLGVWQNIKSSTTMKKRIYATYKIHDKEIVSFGQNGIYIQGVTSGTARVGRPKLEIGNKPTDWSSAPEDIDSSIANVQTQVTTTSNKVATIETNLSSITQRVSATETKVTTVTNDLNNMQIGGRNLQKNTDFKINLADWIVGTGFTRDTSKKFEGVNTVKFTRTGLSSDSISYFYSGTRAILIEVGQVVTASANFYTDNVSSIDGGKAFIGIWFYNSSGGAISSSKTTISFVNGKWVKASHTATAPANAVYAAIVIGTNRNGVYYIGKPMFEKGNKATDWTPSPEDVDSSIANLQTQVTTTSNKVATIETNLSSITQRVSSTESTVSSINGSVTNLTSRVSSAESKLTATSLTTTISSAISGGTGSISTTQFVMDKNGFTVNNGALTIKNKSGTTVFNSDTNGNLIITGTLKSQKGDMFVSLDSGGISFQDYQKKEQTLRIATTAFSDNRDINGITFAMPQYSDFIRFAHISKADLTNGWTSSDTQYKFFDCWSSDQTVGGASYKKGINIYAPAYVNNGLFLNNPLSGVTSDIKGNFSWNNGNGSTNNLLGICGDNGVFLGYKAGETYQSRIVLTESAHPGTGDHIKIWGNLNCSGYTVHNATFSGKFVNSYANEVTRTFTETHCIEAENKQVRISFTDIQLVDGKAILNIPKVYIGINAGYIINSIVKKGKGDVWVLEEQENRFVIEGTADIKVNIEVIINLDNVSPYSLKSIKDPQLCIDMTTGQPIGA